MKPRKFTIVAEINSKPNRQGKHAIFIRVTCQGKKVRIGTGAVTDPKHWDPVKGQVKGSPVAFSLNELIRSKIAKAEKYIYEAQVDGLHISLESIKQHLTGESTTNHTVYSYAIHHTNQMKGRHVHGTLVNYEMEANRIEAYHPGITFERIDNTWLKNYESFNREKGYKNNTLQKIQKTLKTFFNAAIKDGITSHYPFKTFEGVKYRQGERTYLTSEEIASIESKLPDMDKRLRKAAVWFLFGCYSGLRFSDWQRFSPSMIRDGMLHLRTKKTGASVVMPIHSRLAKIIEMLPEIGPPEVEQPTNVLLKVVASLCKIEKNLTCHVSRHSFAVHCAELGISIETTAELLGVSVKTCQIYYKVTGKKVKSEMAKWDQ